MGAAQRSEQDFTVGERLGSSCVPPSIRDVTDNLRARIFSLCSKIGQCVPSAALLRTMLSSSGCVNLFLVMTRVPVLSPRLAHRGQSHLVHY